MPLTPLDIHNKEFSRSFRGYNEDEVNEFLDKIVRDYEKLIKENQDLNEKIKGLTQKLEHYSKIEETLHNAIVVAQETAEEVKQNASREAELIRREAEREAKKIIDEAILKARKIHNEMEEMAKQVHVCRTRFKALLEAQLEMLTSDDWTDLEKKLNEYR
ncbi:cell division initiation protein [Anaerobranca californiensis DSM 14826]|uniref:Cell division initiation protein n=1 Tax=Anaerobranca californiensis DSM 14826 TaxID=1120989 RepID=A0A1M6KT40_9FIRM|nr:DivIVA domain-containing protein [Anaerobranca californiensis]SHJ62044.1 cell division initiation protein [Anaerobranca californiensis DSM 14826]